MRSIPKIITKENTVLAAILVINLIKLKKVNDSMLNMVKQYIKVIVSENLKKEENPMVLVDI